MGYKPMMSTNSNTIDLKKNGSVPVEGTYVGRKNITTKIGEQVIWLFTNDEGSPFGIYGFSNLNRMMESAVVGKLYKLTYKGTKNIKTKFGLKDVHQVLVEEYFEDKGSYNSGEL